MPLKTEVLFADIDTVESLVFIGMFLKSTPTSNTIKLSIYVLVRKSCESLMSIISIIFKLTGLNYDVFFFFFK